MKEDLGSSRSTWKDALGSSPRSTWKGGRRSPARGRSFVDPYLEPEPPAEEARVGLERSLAIGAKTLAGIGIGVLVILVGAATAGIAIEAIVVPSLLLKLAGGIAGGGIGLAKGLGDERRRDGQSTGVGERPRDL